MKGALVVCAAMILAMGHAWEVSMKEIAQAVNFRASWKATTESKIARLNIEDFRALLGVNSTRVVNLPHRLVTLAEVNAAPASFDSRTNWPHCETIKDIRDQGHCGSCWAFSTAEAISDRECIANKENVRISAEDINSCSNCGGCQGTADMMCPFTFWKNHGAVSQDCSPYTVPSCGHVGEPSCPTDVYPTPSCRQMCESLSGLDYKTDKHKAKSVFKVSGEAEIKAEIAANGPCVTSFTVYLDFQLYSGGIYHVQFPIPEGGHAVKIIGWGEESGEKYWLIANSWGPAWGEQGFFRIRRGTNECGIEDACYGGIPSPL